MKDLKFHPEKKSELTKKTMLEYMKDKPIEDKKWFVNLMENNKIKKRNNLTKEQCDTYDLKVIREEFCKKYFKYLSKEYKKEQMKNKTKKTFEDELYELLK